MPGIIIIFLVVVVFFIVFLLRQTLGMPQFVHILALVLGKIKVSI